MKFTWNNYCFFDYLFIYFMITIWNFLNAKIFLFRWIIKWELFIVNISKNFIFYFISIASLFWIFLFLKFNFMRGVDSHIIDVHLYWHVVDVKKGIKKIKDEVTRVTDMSWHLCSLNSSSEIFILLCVSCHCSLIIQFNNIYINLTAWFLFFLFSIQLYFNIQNIHFTYSCLTWHKFNYSVTEIKLL